MIVIWNVDQELLHSNWQSEPEDQQEKDLIQSAESFEDVRDFVLNGRFEAVFILTSRKEVPGMAALQSLNTVIPIYTFTQVDKHAQFIILYFLYYLASVTEESHQEQAELAASRDDVDWDQSLAYIREHLYDNDLSLEQVAKQNYVSKWHFSKIFKKRFGITFREFLIQERVSLAKKLLLTNESVTSVCYAVGYGDLTHFGRIFQKKVGMPPSRYKKLYWKPDMHERRIR
ncbi:helix-turn-helix transcriptional regulator [Marinicrinis sediminis]|uniref:Helix-turn-helix transcriptional regulator n=1 Tax=Marinicrinis sediminis TaxID=1652465 RepID=A0ABW5REY1_9BACL